MKKMLISFGELYFEFCQDDLIWYCRKYKEKNSEGIGFEPTVQFNPYGGLANRCLKPLGHPSKKEFLNILLTKIRMQARNEKKQENIRSLKKFNTLHFF